MPDLQKKKKGGHDTLRYWSRFDNSFQPEDIPKALAAMHLSDFQDNEGFPDTRATAYITKNPGNMTNLVPNKGSDSVMVGNGE